MTGPLAGVRVVELAGIGPGPFCCMMLAQMGATVIRVDRPATRAPDPQQLRLDLLSQGRQSIAVDLKSAAGREVVLRLIESADVLVEGFRPGVTERMGLGPEDCWAVNPRLVYGRMTGWGQDGPLAQAAGHDINYIALTGALAAIGMPGERPIPPLNLVGDFGGGSLYLAFGIVCALLEARGSGKGQVVDAAIVDGATHLMTLFFGMMAAGQFKTERGSNTLDGAGPWYRTYETKDGKYISVGSAEPQFYQQLLDALGLDAAQLPAQRDPAGWAQMRALFAEKFLTRTRDEWDSLLAGTDVCYGPVLTLDEVAAHPHMAARQAVVEVDGIAQPASAPRLSRTPGAVGASPVAPGHDTDAVLEGLGYTAEAIAELRAAKAVA